MRITGTTPRDHLTVTGDDNARRGNASPPGMAHFAGTGPRGKSCGQCYHFEGKHNGQWRLFGPCAKYLQMMGARAGTYKISPNTPSCRYFTPDVPT